MEDEYDIPPPTFEVVIAAVLCGRRLARQFNRDLGGQGLTLGQFHAMSVLQRTDGWIHAAAVGRRMGVSRQAAHALVQQIDERGLLSWMDDGWIKSVQLRREGDTVLADARRALEDTMEAVERLSVTERKTIVRAQESVNRELKRATYPRYDPFGNSAPRRKGPPLYGRW